MLERLILSPNHLAWRLGIPREVLLELAANAVRHYHPFFLKRPGKKPREIDNPDRVLKNAQQRIHRNVLKPLVLPKYLHGGLKGRSPYTNALQHLGKRMVIRLDLEDFFPTVTDLQVYSVWAKTLECSPPVAGLLTSLTTYRQRLPQGAPTSSALANLVLLHVDREIHQAAAQSGCEYTRYIDDLVFSGDRPQDLITASLQALRGAGFRVSRDKLALMPATALQEVTGLSVNSRQKPSVPRYRRDQIKAAIFELGRTPQGTDFQRKADSVRGRIAHLARINPGSAESLARSLEEVLQERFRSMAQLGTS